MIAELLRVNGGGKLASKSAEKMSILSFECSGYRINLNKTEDCLEFSNISVFKLKFIKTEHLAVSQETGCANQCIYRHARMDECTS